MKKYYGKKLLITTCCILAITAFSGCSKKMGQVEVTKEPEVKQEVDVEVKPLEYTTHPLPTEEPDLPTVPSFNSKEDEKEFKLLKQDISVYIKNEYETPKEHVEGIVKNLNEWDVAGVSDAFYGVYEYPEGEYVINGYSDSLQEEWNKVKGTVTYEELGLIETYKTGNPLMEYKIIFDIEEPGNLNLNKGENVRYLYIMLVSLDEDDSDYESVAGIDLMRYERIKEYDYLANYDDISSFGIGMSDEWYEKKINEDMVAVKADPNRDYSIDLDGDGKSEKISMSAVYEEYNYKTEGEPFIDYRRENKFYCDDKKVEELGLYSGEFESGNYATEGFYIIDIDNWDQYKEIAVEYYYNMNYRGGCYSSRCMNCLKSCFPRPLRRG